MASALKEAHIWMSKQPSYSTLIKCNVNVTYRMLRKEETLYRLTTLHVNGEGRTDGSGDLELENKIRKKGI